MELISVTTPLGVYFDRSSIPARTLDAAAARGTAVHAACAAYAERLPVILGAEGWPYFESFRQWSDRYVKRVLFVEEEFVDRDVYHIKGHPDLVAELLDGMIAVIDYKTPQVEARTWRAQVAAYRYLVGRRLRRDDVRPLALILDSKGGEAKGIVYPTSAADFAAFVAALTAYRYFRG